MTIRHIRKLILPALACTGLAGAAPTIIEVGPNRTYATILEAIQGENLYQPFTNDVVIKVDDGVVDYEAVHLVDADALGNMGNFTFTIEGAGAGAPPAEEDVTYYVGGEGEYRFDASGDVTIVENLEANSLLGRRLRTATTVLPEEFYLFNHLGSTVTSVDASGSRVGPVFEYFPYGKTRTVLGAQGSPITETFTGKEFDTYSENPEEDGEGLHYFGVRYLDSDIGLWISPDPCGQHFSPYTYGSNNPMIRVDPDGCMDLYAFFENLMGWAADLIGPGEEEAKSKPKETPYSVHPPLQGNPSISSDWGATESFRTAAHKGRDYPVPVGTRVYAAEAGQITLVQRGNARAGNWLRLKVNTGPYADFAFEYMHLSEIEVDANESVARGQLIGLSGNTGRSTGPHLHIQVRNASGALVRPGSIPGL